MRYILEGVAQLKPFGCACKRCSNKDDDDRPVGGCLCRGYPTVRTIREAIARLEANHTVVHMPTPLATARYLAEERARLELRLVGAAPVPTMPAAPAGSGLGTSCSSGAASASASASASSSAGASAGGAASASATAEPSATAAGGDSPQTKRKRKPTAAERRAASGEPQRPADHLKKKPVRPADVGNDDKWPRVQSCNYAILVSMHRDETLRECGEIRYTKSDLMTLASCRKYGQLSEVDLYDTRAGPGAAAGPHGYDGFSNVAKGLVKPPPPWRELVRSFNGQRCGTTDPGTRYVLTDAGRVLAARLHAEAEEAGYCNCGKVAKATIAATPGNKPVGWRLERLPTLRAIIDDRGPDSAGGLRLAHETSLAEWERVESDFQRRYKAWRDDPVAQLLAKQAAQSTPKAPKATAAPRQPKRPAASADAARTKKDGRRPCPRGRAASELPAHSGWSDTESDSEDERPSRSVDAATGTKKDGKRPCSRGEAAPASSLELPAHSGWSDTESDSEDERPSRSVDAATGTRMEGKRPCARGGAAPASSSALHVHSGWSDTESDSEDERPSRSADAATGTKKDGKRPCPRGGAAPASSSSRDALIAHSTGGSETEDERPLQATGGSETESDSKSERPGGADSGTSTDGRHACPREVAGRRASSWDALLAQPAGGREAESEGEEPLPWEQDEGTGAYSVGGDGDDEKGGGSEGGGWGGSWGGGGYGGGSDGGGGDGGGRGDSDSEPDELVQPAAPPLRAQPPHTEGASLIPEGGSRDVFRDVSPIPERGSRGRVAESMFVSTLSAYGYSTADALSALRACAHVGDALRLNAALDFLLSEQAGGIEGGVEGGLDGGLEGGVEGGVDGGMDGAFDTALDPTFDPTFGTALEPAFKPALKPALEPAADDYRVDGPQCSGTAPAGRSENAENMPPGEQVGSSSCPIEL